MMKKLIILYLLLLLVIPVFAQLEVKEGSFKEVPGFININPDPNYQTDDNDLPFAVVKVRTENITDKQRRELRFESNLAVGVNLEYKTGEVWVYLTAKYADYLKISHPDFGVCEFTLPFDLQPKKGYEMALVYKSFTPASPVKEVYNFMIITADQPNATIYIDNEYVGDKEVYKPYRAGEKHSWRIECELYHSESGEAIIPVKEGENVNVEKKLRPAHGYLNITSKPENGAVVFIDDKKVGQTPYKSDKLASGEHKVRVMKEMFVAVEKTFTVTDGNITQASMTMAANFVSVNITTDSESDIYVDNEKKGKGRWNGRLSDGPHSLEARKASHKTSIKNVQLTIGAAENIVIPDPEPIYGTLEVVSNPIGANIIIDGKNYGTTPRVLGNVLIGSHELRLEKNGCTTITKSFTLDDKNKLNINEKLETDREIAIDTDKTFTVNGVTFDMVAVKGDTFTMGGTQEQGDEIGSDEKPTHSITLSDYYIGKYEVTQDLWQAVMGINPSYNKGKNLPVEQVSWNDVQEFIRKLNQKTGANFRLPTEAEWEYAARGGNKSQGYKYSGGNTISNVSWFMENSEKKTHQVGTKAPNELKIYDMSGNVWEWCQDWYGNYNCDSQTNPKGVSSSSYRILRGGSWSSDARCCRVSYRGINNPDFMCNYFGFRLALGVNDESSVINMTSLPEESVIGVYSVSSNKKVQFSKGNLQYQASTRTWRFAEHQWDIIDKANENISSSYSGWIDLFGWGTSGYNRKDPWMTSTTSADYGNGENDIAGTYYDWGVSNTISNGRGNNWRTLTRDEWVYLFDIRSTSSGIRYAKATVNGVCGIILFPDRWRDGNYSLNNTNKYDASYSSNHISQSDWQNKFELNGAVFLPAAGFRIGVTLYGLNSIGHYWSAWHTGSSHAYYLYFSDEVLEPYYWDGRSYGCSVRLVCDVE